MQKFVRSVSQHVVLAPPYPKLDKSILHCNYKEKEQD